MKSVLLIFSLLLTSQAWADEEMPVVQECTTEAMHSLTMEALAYTATGYLNGLRIEFEPEDVLVNYVGRLDFITDFDFEMIDGEVQQVEVIVEENAYTVDITTLRGTALNLYSTIDDLIDGKVTPIEPLHEVVSLPDPVRVNNYDNEGNIVSESCIVFNRNEESRLMLLRNRETKKVLAGQRFGFSRAKLAEALIQP